MSKFQAPRGTHDVLPRDHLWWRVLRTLEEQCAQDAWSRTATPDAEVIQFYAELLRRLGVTEWTLMLNSIGDENCRPQYVAQLSEWLDAHPELLEDEEVAHKRTTTVLQVFDVKNDRLRAALDLAPKIGDSLCDACRQHFETVKAHLDAYGVPYTLDSSLVRGLDYYTRTTFE